ncbi:MAG: ornithine cyclodeaminase [Pseudomonadota bacterium]
MVHIVSAEMAEPRMDWLELSNALAAGHELPKAELGDTFLYRRADTMLTRSAWIDGMGVAVKTATAFPENEGPKINGAVSVFSDEDGTLEALIDFHLVTKWKTAGDSLLAARRLARPDSAQILIVGAGTVAGSMVEAYRSAFPAATIQIWNRTDARAQELAVRYEVETAVDLPAAVAAADIICCATMSREPVLQGEWVSPGTHIDLIGAFRSDMREADDETLRRARLFVDNRGTTIGHIGELMIPLADGVIKESDVLADFYDLPHFRRESDDDITVCKNGGGAHLDLMTCRYILEVLNR